MDEEQSKMLKIAAYIGLGVLGLVMVIILNPIVIVGAGERGVVFNNTSGIEDRVLGEGLHMRIPFIQSVKKLSVKVQKNDVTAPAASKDLQTVSTQVAVNWHLDSSQVHRAYQEIGDEQAIIDRIITPNVQEVVKAATAQKTAEETLTKRAELKIVVDQGLTERLAAYHIIVDDVSIVDVDFSDEFNKAIERKAQAEQDALAERNKLESIKYQAEQKLITAKADAESIRIRSEALSANQRLVEWEAVQKWNGVLPQYTGGVIPFLPVK